MISPNFKKTPIALALLGAMTTLPALAETQLDTVTVEADFHKTSIEKSTASVTVITAKDITKRGARALDDVLGNTPNVNVSGGGNGAKYFQIRGIGERGQFNTPLNPSVGVMVDDFNFSRTSGAATLFDVKQVEVLRGPQGTTEGSSALAGSINLKSNEATNHPEAHVEVMAGNRNTFARGVALGGPIIKNKLLGRIALYKYQSDGYMENTYLNRKDTQNNDEFTGRLNLKWKATDKLSFDFKALKLDQNNGYDAFSFENGYQTITDQPGHDNLNTTAFALKAGYQVSPKVNMLATATTANTDTEYGYDDDWTYAGYPGGYSAFDNYKRKRKTNSFDLRFSSSSTGRIFNGSTDWVGGVHYLSQDERLDRTYAYLTGGKASSDYNTVNTSAYGQLDHHLNSKTTLTGGLRVENFQADYTNSSGFSKKTSEPLFGGKLAVAYQVNSKHLAFLSLSKGYKAGGVNDDASLPASKVAFDTESLWNLETGLNSSMFNKRLKTRLNIFYAIRKDQQVKSSTQKVNSPSFILYTDNAAEGNNYGLEAQADWLMNDHFRVLANIGLLDATFVDYTYVDPNNTANQISKNGRAQAHAPAYQFSLGGEVYVNDNWTLAANVEGKDKFYFSNTHDQQSKAYALLNGSIEYNRKNWTVTAWGRNLADTAYDTRGYYFGIDPRTGYADGLYTQKGEPRTFGVTVAYDY